MRVLVLGANGMLGHKVYQACRKRFNTMAAIRAGYLAQMRPQVSFELFDLTQIWEHGSDLKSSIANAVEAFTPDVVVNCIGVVKQRAADRPSEFYRVNTGLPHYLATICAPYNIRLIHISTDCVFSGNNGQYTEDDTPDPMDTYGWSKLLGEVTATGCLTLRTSIIGRELITSRGLAEWFINQRGGYVTGWIKAIFSGLTTNCLGSVIADVIEHHPSLHGLYHISSKPISKLDLLRLLNRSFDLGVTIAPDDSIVCDRSLNSSRFRATTRWQPLSWEDMIEDMKSDPTPYNKLR